MSDVGLDGDPGDYSYEHLTRPPNEPSAKRPQGAPEPGTGAVFVIANSDGTWEASWQTEARCYDSPRGLTRDEAIAWALEQPATRWWVYEGRNREELQRPSI
ncbi:hypothetical protein [Terrabacter sp. MAHUQ-38]|uniref:hypothetical protein n=1 Tax=unclassified Terrabacter TaxID=2630222 RepID=UPI00165DBB4E|nr:hypothetical protein [Terrabacter sp. MAHUQ-38]MBC9819691.1 hypothetical protein [Terrabacter sp. MAHUQ-38]